MAQYPNKEFQQIYDNLRASLGSDDELRSRIEAALRPMYDQSRAQLEEQRRANNAAIDTDAYSRGMGNSTWVTDAKLQQLRGMNNSMATLDANYNNQLFGALYEALKDRDDTAYNQAMQWWQIGQKRGGGSGKPNTTLTVTENPLMSFDEWAAMYGTPEQPQVAVPNASPSAVPNTGNKKYRSAGGGGGGRLGQVSVKQ